jgi:hypothetical protein
MSASVKVCKADEFIRDNGGYDRQCVLQMGQNDRNEQIKKHLIHLFRYFDLI